MSASQVKLLEARAAVVTASFKSVRNIAAGCDDLQTALARSWTLPSHRSWRSTADQRRRRLQVNLSAGEVRLSSGGAEILAKATGGLQLGLLRRGRRQTGQWRSTSPRGLRGADGANGGFEPCGGERNSTWPQAPTSRPPVGQRAHSGSSQLTSGPGEVRWGEAMSDSTSQPATGSSLASEGARQLQKDGTSKIYTSGELVEGSGVRSGLSHRN